MVVVREFVYLRPKNRPKKNLRPKIWVHAIIEVASGDSLLLFLLGVSDPVHVQRRPSESEDSESSTSWPQNTYSRREDVEYNTKVLVYPRLSCII